MNIILDNYTPLISYLSPASIPQIVAHIQEYLVNHPILSVQTVAEIIVQSLQEHPELLNGEAIPISADSEQSIKAYIDALPFLDTYTKAEINALLLGKQDTLTFDQAPTPGSSNPVTSSGIIAAMSALQSALETQISAKADRASTYTKNQVDTLLEDKADADDVYSKNTMDAKLLEVNTDIDNLEDALSDQSQQIDGITNSIATVENETTATQNIPANTYFYHNGDLCFTPSLISQGSTIPSGLEVPNGGLNDLFGKMASHPIVYGTTLVSTINLGTDTDVANITLSSGIWVILGQCEFRYDNIKNVWLAIKNQNAVVKKIELHGSTSWSTLQAVAFIQSSGETYKLAARYRDGGSTCDVSPSITALKIF